jgi:hypothetical protein
LPLSNTLEIAKSLGFHHPPLNGDPEVITTDFMLTVRCGNELSSVARTVKKKADLKTCRLFQKLEIERRYYEERSIDWGIVTDANLPSARCHNVDWFHECRSIKKLEPLSADEVKRIARAICKKVVTAPTIVFAVFAGECDEKLKLQPGNTLKVIRFLFANKIWLTDMDTVIKTDQPTTIEMNLNKRDWR